MKQAIGSKEACQRRALYRALRRVRKVCRLKQTDVAVRLGVPQSFVSKYESGQRRLDFIDLLAVCAALESDLPSLMEVFKAELAKEDKSEA